MGDVEYTHTYTGQKLGGNDNRDTRHDVKAVRIDPTITSIGKEAFKYCYNLTTVDIHDNVTSIENEAFSDCLRLKSITIPSSVQTIGRNAFMDCFSLESVHVSASTNIGPFAFDGCPNLDEESKQRIYKYYNKVPTLTNNFQQGRGPRHGFQGATQKGYGPELWGITLQQIIDITHHPDITPHTSMRDVVEIAIKPATKGLGIGYSLLVNQDKPLRARVMVSVSSNNAHFTINCFVLHSVGPFAYTIQLLLLLILLLSNLQHAWEESIQDFIISLQNSGEEGPYWVCAFSIYQNQGDDDKPTIAEQLGTDPDFGPFATVLKQANIMLAVVTALCDIYTRLW